MTSFDRKFNAAALIGWDSARAGNAVRKLFELWCLPGEASAGRSVLRLAVRNKYLNYYIKGQSVAKLSLGPKGPNLSVHEAYFQLRQRDRSVGRTSPAVQRYEKFDAEALADIALASRVDGWVETAETYSSAEKRFVDDLVAANPGVLDLEMALPAGDVEGDRVAPRMDIVVAQLAAGQPASLSFWEAKCAINPEVRSKASPKVIGQLRKYTAWIEQGNRVAEVQGAYQRAAEVMLQLRQHFRPDAATAKCITHWQAISDTKPPAIVLTPGLVIGNYWPQGYTEQIASGRMAQAAASFTENQHRATLEAAGVLVHEVAPDDHDARALPYLKAAIA